MSLRMRYNIYLIYKWFSYLRLQHVSIPEHWDAKKSSVPPVAKHIPMLLHSPDGDVSDSPQNVAPNPPKQFWNFNEKK